ncbi:beta-1,4-mannosyl-glycoprotein 4-beta-N-acetylglucosaminyltransferase-like [Dermacentor albipictus]|uniref:beta-1,4-mannosyl-glycoprotein 4-beta-N-acetylglucosaminyltransferase-like n=1 Tax=Dermacentor albipictus TaxID=60249 RepID=UPI0038FD0706
MVFNHELDLLEIRVKELGDAVDYYLVVESTYAFSGVEKPLHLRSNLSAGFLREHAHKIVPISVDFYNYDDGNPWGPENYLRTSVWYEGHRRLKNISDDDLFIMSDADEIPSRDVVLFLKHHDGYGEPILLSLRWFMYGFFWENSVPVNVVIPNETSACTVLDVMDSYCGWDRFLHSVFMKRSSSFIGLSFAYYAIVVWEPLMSEVVCLLDKANKELLY